MPPGGIAFLKIQATVALLATWEGFRKRESQKTCRITIK
jgi:hypothetical protein